MNVQQYLEYLDATEHDDKDTVALQCGDSALTLTLGEFKQEFNEYKIY